MSKTQPATVTVEGKTYLADKTGSYRKTYANHTQAQAAALRILGAYVEHPTGYGRCWKVVIEPVAAPVADYAVN